MLVAFIAGLAIAVAALYFTGVIGDAWQTMRSAKPLPLLLVVVTGMTLPIVHALRWRVVMRSMDVEILPSDAADITVSSSLLNYASPGFVGASAKAILANRTQQAPFRATALSIAFEHSLDLTLMVISSAAAILILGPSRFRDALEPLERYANVATAIVSLIVLLIVTLVVLKYGLWRYVQNAFRTVVTIGRRVDTRQVALLSLIYWLLQVVVGLLLFWSLSLPLNPVNIVAIVTIPTLAGMLAPVPGGVGVREAATLALTTVTGVGATALLSLAILQRVLLIGSLPLSLAIIRLERKFGPSDWHIRS